MKIAAVDNELSALNILTRAIEEALPDAEVKSFRKASALLETARDGFAPDVAFLDIEMPGMSGLELAKRLKDIHGDTNIVFVTGFKDYALDALRLRASGYLLKPATPEKVKEEIDHLRIPLPAQKSEKRLRVQCFGSFEVFVDDQPVYFPRRRAKELLAYFIDRCGATSTLAEIAEVLWDSGQYGESERKQIHTFLSSLSKTLDDLGVGKVLVKKYNAYGIDVRYVDCDLYRCTSDAAAINTYHGAYMSQYSWAEFTEGELTLKYQ